MAPVKTLIKSTFLSMFLIATLSSFANPDFFSNSPTKWEKIDNGIDLAELDYKRWMNPGKIYGIKISSPRKLKILTDTSKSTTLDNLKRKFKPLVLINGSFFDENFNPVGLLKIKNRNVRRINKQNIHVRATIANSIKPWPMNYWRQVRYLRLNARKRTRE